MKKSEIRSAEQSQMGNIPDAIPHDSRTDRIMQFAAMNSGRRSVLAGTSPSRLWSLGNIGIGSLAGEAASWVSAYPLAMAKTR